MERKTGKDYKKDYRALLNKLEAIDAKVSKRLLELCKKHPDATITTVGDTKIKAKSIASESYIKSIELPARITCIETIEKYLADLHPHQQLNINYENQPMVNNNEGEGIGLNNFK